MEEGYCSATLVVVLVKMEESRMHQMPRLFGWIYKNDLQRLKNLWEEFEALVPAPTCNCAKSKEYVLHLQQLKLFQFLMGLNESYIQARYLDD
ncbi:hypothetical protein KY290_005500 [Solanum tuberosum]|uniref:Uncharacterized protein n=1 Tax=Solanum tuberosum TaxID=4113 RepID=A0ABQ7WEE8_SOLTU|nr:hypothetical protein KY289_005887 [Solanum tuberosum]KAH0779073.1 hypothetical protein KY290_005500 [Solanum tuberosum]